jgi:hypothetical protein
MWGIKTAYKGGIGAFPKKNSNSKSQVYQGFQNIRFQIDTISSSNKFDKRIFDPYVCHVKRKSPQKIHNLYNLECTQPYGMVGFVFPKAPRTINMFLTCHAPNSGA